MANLIEARIGDLLRRGLAIPACPLALTAERRLDERRQRALVRYYATAGAGGLAVGVHTTQFAIRDPAIGLFEPLLRLVAEELDRADRRGGTPLVRISGICGRTGQARAEAELARDCGYHAGLLSLAALGKASEDELIAHVQAVAEVIPLIGFYLQPAVGGHILPFSFWRRFAEMENVVAIKIAPFNRYQTLDVVRAVVEAGRDDLALYTGNDDNIVIDLLTPFRFTVNGQAKARRIVGGLLGHWAVWTRRAVELLDECHRLTASGAAVPVEMLRRNAEVTDANAAVFDAANGFAGCIAGIHEVLRRQGLLEGLWCLDPAETLGPGQAEELDRVCRAYPHLIDDDFVRENLDHWLSG
ncbi:dihydrodipicolinate synthase family protein [Singulisphaera acidiphila]|uniref:Dihydrodipicolinate synthase/N-acetylneuraminate lyase n=1 Tax=Singulisphaera acidiphila (strain ATCC BAA-1392 / DSM 18658 / VKM B-2454 / MOB10) TaxID=886293 RepID=L0D892_SINAD|nr:dihydrodipicolinate synthase family protein [Singulisphaera acidiphila]AGA25085.1 dihydrodipicolinate synthase/N-acetylneuraminate lyase [Singulisphaera acidiphila DSM 18658]